MDKLICMVALLSGCSVLVEHEAAQCTTDAACAHWGHHPFCDKGVCVASGLGPEGCIYGALEAQSDYLNACTTAAYVAFDNCTRLGECRADGGMPMTVDPTNGAIPPLVNPVTPPTALCS